MTLVNAETGEVATDGDLTAEEAELLLSQTLAAAEMTVAGVTRLYLGRAWIALGFESWDDLCEKHASHLRMMRWPREERQEIVASLRESGLSIRAIAATGIASKQTVERDLAGVMNHDTSPDPAPVDAPWTPDIAPVPEPEPAPVAPRPITGIDGKTYTPPAPKPKPETPRRSPLADQARSAGWEFRKSVERLERIAADDRYPANAEQVAAHLRGHLTYAIEVCQDLLDGFDTSPQEN